MKNHDVIQILRSIRVSVNEGFIDCIEAQRLVNAFLEGMRIPPLDPKYFLEYPASDIDVLMAISDKIADLSE